MVSTAALNKHAQSIQLLNEQLRNLKFKSPGHKKEFTQSFDDWLMQHSPFFSWDVAHLIYIRQHLAQLLDGIITHLLIFCPPRHGKSEMTTIRFPVYFLNKYPRKRVVVGAYNTDLALFFSRESRRLARNILHLDPMHQSLAEWGTIEGGTYRAVGVGKGITGRGGDLIIVDDPVKSREEANSETFREKCWYWFTNDLYTRREPGAKFVIIQTRWHEDDLSGRILASEFAADWSVIELPANAFEDDPLGRAEGEALWPARYNEEALRRIKKVLGTDYEALYQQRPTSPTGNILEINLIRDYDELPETSFIVIAMDTAFKEKEENDFSVGLIFAVCKNGIYIIDRWKKKAKYPELKAETKRLAHRYNANVILIEDAASGQSLIQDLQAESRLNVVAVSVDKSKTSRANACTDTIRAGRVFVPKNAVWVKDFKYNLAMFPFGKHDDDVDAFTLGINYITKRFANTFPVYQDYNDDLYCVIAQPEEFEIVNIKIGVYLDTMSTVVVAGLTEFSQVIVLNEFSTMGSIEDLLFKQVFPWITRLFSSVSKQINVYSERTDRRWFEQLTSYKLNLEDLSGVDKLALIGNVEQMLSDIIKKRPALLLLGSYCPDLREGFFGAYCYKARKNITSEEIYEKPIKNKYSRVHVALQAALYDYYIAKEEQYELPDDEGDEYISGLDEVGGY